MRLIDADALLEDVRKNSASYFADDFAREWVDKQPTIEPERKTGKWINGHWDGDSNFRIDGRGNCWYVRECSNCHEEIEGKPTNYCPNCGARMLKEGD